MHTLITDLLITLLTFYTSLITLNTARHIILTPHKPALFETPTILGAATTLIILLITAAHDPTWATPTILIPTLIGGTAGALLPNTTHNWTRN